MPVQCGPESEQDLSMHKDDGSQMPSVVDQIKLMQDNMSMMLQKAEQEEEELKNLADGANSLMMENEMLEAKTAKLYLELSIKQGNIENLQQKNETLEYDMQQSINTLQQEKDKLGTMIDCTIILQEKNASLEAKVQSMEQTMCERQETINSLLQVKSTQEAKVKHLEQTLHESQQNNNRLQAEDSMLQDRVQSVACALYQREEIINSLQQEKDKLDVKVKDLEQTLHEGEQINNTLQEENSMLQDNVHCMASTLYQKEENINSLQRENGTLDTKVKDLECTLINWQQNINDLLHEMGTLKAEVQELEDTKLMHTHQIHDFKMTKEALQNALYSSSYEIRYRSLPEKNGCALIINNTQFTTSEMGERTGAEGDTQKLAEAFRSLPVNIEVKTYQDLDLPTMLSVLEEEANRDHTDEDFFICSIMTHGTQGKVYAANGYGVDILDIVSTFNGKRCPSLIGKPKLFFIQACQGDKHQSSDRANANSDASPSSILAYLSTEADFFLALATVPGYAAYRGEDGAHFVNVLARVLKEHGKSQDLMSMMATASKELNEKYEYSPFCCTTLRRKLFFDHALEQSRFVN
ncbi:caspase-1-B-like [Branchiostoma floridae]|uniref:Caspase-1-B-like n=1 Tax=Branchiostoma floridae TaxID=7739 RepID=A0A9J7MY70_BRAFL|nr:caspase-1-B-like [Branchiostoma floridae]